MLGDLSKTYTVVNWRQSWQGVLEGSHYIRPNFQVAEFACSDGSGIILVNSRTLNAVQKIRDYLGKPLTINSANRTAQHNMDIGGVEHSYHVSGDAIDIKIPYGMGRYEFLGHVKKALGKDVELMGIGIYKTFIHIDYRGYKARWYG